MTSTCEQCGLKRSVPECPCVSRVVESDPVNPAHYQGDYVMRIIEDFELDFLSGTIVKYLLRAGNKPGESSAQDFRKAKWYLERKLLALPTTKEPLP